MYLKDMFAGDGGGMQNAAEVRDNADNDASKIPLVEGKHRSQAASENEGNSSSQINLIRYNILRHQYYEI